MRALLIVALFGASALAANLVSCTRNGIVSPGDRFPWWPAEENVSHHFPNENICSTWETPYCIVMNAQNVAYDPNDEATHEYGCAECRSTCDCKLGFYCQTEYSEQDDFGKCVSYKHKIGTPCNPDLSIGDTQKDMFYGDAMACATFIEYKDYQHNYTRRGVTWQGACVNGKCRECNSYMLPQPWHFGSDMWYTQSAQSESAARTLFCLWESTPGTAMSDAPYKYRPRRCVNFAIQHHNGIATAAPAALLLVAAAAFAF